MDEPFGALDAIERTRLQTELRMLHHRLQKTVLFVTHDIDEALRLADSIVVMRNGRFVQYASPLEILARPADAFVAELAGAGDLVRRFSLITVGDALRNGSGAAAATPASLPVVDAHSDLRAAFSAMLAAGTLQVRIVDESGADVGVLSFEKLLQAARAARTGEMP
jgi:osmoprotectant transport system ATP-binding protein